MFIENYASKVAPLRELARAKGQFIWLPKHQEAFNIIRQSLTSDALAYFDREWITELVVDASPSGLGAILRQRNPKNLLHRVIIQYASRYLTQVEQRYPQIEKEGLACYWGCIHFHLYLYGCNFILITDNKPVEMILNNPNSKPSVRMERFAVKLAQYKFKVKHEPGKYNEADYLSRQPVESPIYEFKDDSDYEIHINSLVDRCIPKALSRQELCKATVNDSMLQRVIKHIQNGTEMNSPDLTTYKQMANELSVTSDGLLLKQTKLVIPASLRFRVIQLAHEGHQGFVKTRKLLTLHLWFEGLYAETEQYVKACDCQTISQKTIKAPLIILLFV